MTYNQPQMSLMVCSARERPTVIRKNKPLEGNFNGTELLVGDTQTLTMTMPGDSACNGTVNEEPSKINFCSMGGDFNVTRLS